MRKIVRVVLLSLAVLLTSDCRAEVHLRELTPEIVAGAADPHYSGREHMRAADAVVVAVVRNVIEHGRPFRSQFSRAIYLQETELVITPEYAIKGELAGSTVSVRANLLSYESSRALGYRAFKPEAGQRWILFLRREREWRMLFDLFEVGIRVLSGKPEASILSRVGDSNHQAAALLVTPGHEVEPRVYCEGLPKSAAYARLLVAPEELLRILESVRAPGDGCVERAVLQEIESIRQGGERHKR